METKVSPQQIKTDSAGLAWYCLRSQAKHEHIAAAHLRKLEGVAVFCPRIRLKKMTRRCLVWVTEAMFPGYLFAHFDLAEMHRRVRYARGVAGIVRFGDLYPTIDDAVLAQLRDRVGGADVKELSYKLSQGDKVRIAEGAFAGLEVCVTRALPAKERVKVLMDFLGRKIEAEIEHSRILPPASHPLAAQPFGRPRS
jgi:transcriptional antiterminator RfaH